MPPSKGKRQQPSPRAPSSRSSPDRGGGGGGSTSVDLPSIASAAAARFPALVPRGGAGCLAGTVDDVAPRAGSRGGGLGRLWLSEAAMVGAGMRPGCLVSVSSCFLTFCPFDLRLFVSANCLCEPASLHPESVQGSAISCSNLYLRFDWEAPLNLSQGH